MRRKTHQDGEAFIQDHELGDDFGAFGAGHDIIDPRTTEGEDGMIELLDMVSRHGEEYLSSYTNVSAEAMLAMAPTGLEPAPFHTCQGCPVCVPEMLVVRVAPKPRQHKKAIGNTRRSAREIVRRHKEVGLFYAATAAA